MRAGFYTLGCKLNQSETEALADAFRRAGHTAAGVDEPADVYILNTCTVTSKSEQKARRVLRKILTGRGESPVIVTGCYAQLEKARLEEEFGPGVLVLGLDQKARLLDLPSFLSDGTALPGARILDDFFAQNGAAGGAFGFSAARCSFHTRAFLKIQDGCDNRCAYCRVCLARGPSVSLEAEEALRRFRALQAEGYREVVLTGVNLMSYASGSTDFCGLLEKLAARAASARIRISSLEPEGITKSLARAAAHPRVCPHFHLPLQSGSDSVLRAMGRRYTRAMVTRAVDLLRAERGGAFIAADIICGFPGETEEDHAQTETLVRELSLASLHVFPFSPRPGTAAWNMKNRVPERTARRRAASLRALAAEGRARYAESLTGGSLEVIVEKRIPGGWEGLSENYMTVRGASAPGGGPSGVAVGALLTVKISGAGDGFLLGEISERGY
ncbi:MAG: tRNA (N(6)-L-threonylcarbamoyladenosine(37)-C(2))-methylthiotransferase MtaB [Spirochaetales bacterium]|jgi:threonylcarbamoyladenosine tRNA methylthiotransferase MtaB|nr:tRNA (N(6)-L-threonylcarbamoyladenosine(37)-C(2))-methylthiotransferase MtaB [Spirochaetales bacterium]